MQRVFTPSRTIEYKGIQTDSADLTLDIFLCNSAFASEQRAGLGPLSHPLNEGIAKSQLMGEELAGVTG